VPILTVGGWNDQYFRSGTLSMIEAAPERTWAIYGPWGHAPPVNVGGLAATVPDALPSGVLLAWFDRWVREMPNVPIPAKPTFVSYEGPKAGAGKGWHDLPGWSADGTAPTTFGLGSDGLLSPSDAVAGEVSFHEPAEPDQAQGSAAFTTTPLETDRVLLGQPTLQLRATLSAPDANFYVELIDVGVDGREVVVNDGFLKASHRRSHVDPTPVTPSAPSDYEIAVRADDYRFAAGHRVRVRISGGSRGALVPPATPVDITLHVGPASTLRIPGFASTS
jgi:predicted acyl esterase